MTEKNLILKLTGIIIVFSLAGYFLEQGLDIYKNMIPDSFEETLEIISEIFSAFVAFSIFSITWHSYTKSKDNQSLFLGTTFFIVGLLILFHLFSYSFMPEFITPNSDQKAAIFLIESRVFLALLLLASVYIRKDTLPGLINKRVMALLIIVISSILLTSSLFFQSSPFTGNDLDNYSTTTIFLFFIINTIIVYSAYGFYKEFKKTGQDSFLLLIFGLIIIVFSNLLYFSYEFSGHFLIIAGFFFIYLSLYKSSVEFPYEKLAVADEGLRISEEKYRSLVESTEDSIYMVDRKCNYLFINHNHMLHLGLKDFHGKNYSDCHLKNQTVQFSDSVARIFNTGKREQQEYEYRGRWFLKTLSPVKDQKTKEILAVTVISTDITDRKNVDELRAENLSLEYASRAKSEFLAIMSHELRTPLNSIIGFSELLKGGMNGELNEKQQHYVDNVLLSGKFLLDLINDVLDLSKIEAGKIDIMKERFSVPIMIRETLDLVKEIAAKKNVIIEKELDPQLDFIESDHQRFKQVLFNLVSNAIKFSKNEGGTVAIRAIKEGDMAKFSISDTGIGIREEDMSKLFQRFEQLDSGITRQYGGTGLGLAISRKLVELMGGRITVESIYDKGSTFTFFLPLDGRNDNI